MRRVGIIAVMLVLLGGSAFAAEPTPVVAFDGAWAAITSYTAIVKVHEVSGKDVQDRTYRYSYLKPHFAKIEITSGPGRGSAATWTGGDTVRGHQGGIASFISLTVPIHDKRAVSLRGNTIDRASFQTIADNCTGQRNEPGTPETIDGSAVDVVSCPIPPGSEAGGATRQAIAFSRTTHLPVRRLTYQGDEIVVQEDFESINPAAGLTEASFR